MQSFTLSNSGCRLFECSGVYLYNIPLFASIRKAHEKQGGDMNETVTDISSDPVKNALLSLAVESWRFTRA